MDKPNLSIRHSNLSNLPEIQRMFVDTISAVCKDDYSPEEIKVWTSSIENTERLIDKLTTQYFLIAELDNKIVGFASLKGNDYLDFLYVHKDYQRQGIADRLYSEIEAEAIKKESKVLTSDVSITAKAFFEKKGFRTLQKQTNIIRGVEIVNYKMVKELL
ncbi:MAG: GNAT family N-acetyltransferase [Ignavibacteriae bacterium HGW-Ignavibacteriae-1]|jgi:putative acetyltransferase|nr:MAG: GNAT family N-acetyltransferase [Ignavibacteriae bacterium HGW-Ignavibacteriae-1]